MTKFIALLPLVFLAACERNHSIGMSNTPSETSVLFVGAGQSNMSMESNLSQTFPNVANVAVGGTPMRAWQRGTPNYAKLVDTCKSSDLRCVILFWDGETDAYYENQPQDVLPLFLTMVDNLRQDLNYEVKIVYVQIGQNDVRGNGGQLLYTGWETVQQMQLLAEHRRPSMVMVESRDMFPGSGDGIHYTLDQYKIIQQRMLDAWRTMPS